MTTKNCVTTHDDPNGSWTLHQGDIQQVLSATPSSTFDGILTDPPYGIGFMGHDWDGGIPPAPVWQELLRVSRPGAYLLAFGSPRTFHRLFSMIEDAGWKICDTLSWLHGQGFPKSHSIEKAVRKRGGNAKLWAGYGTGLKPAWEPICLAQKPYEGTYAHNALKYGCGALNIGQCRVVSGSEGTSSIPVRQKAQRQASPESEQGRWPANVLLDETAAGHLDQQAGRSRSCRGKRRAANRQVGNGRTLHKFISRYEAVEGYNDEGGRSRFFYVAKADKRERRGNPHPAVKPLKLLQQIGLLILPPRSKKRPTRLLVPFSGSGSEMIGGLRSGWDHVTGIEQCPEYVQVAKKRLKNWDQSYGQAS